MSPALEGTCTVSQNVPSGLRVSILVWRCDGYLQVIRDSPAVWPLCAFFFILLQFYVPFYVKKKKIDNFMCLLEFECAKRLKAHSRAIPGHTFHWNKICSDIHNNMVMIYKSCSLAVWWLFAGHTFHWNRICSDIHNNMVMIYKSCSELWYDMITMRYVS